MIEQQPLSKNEIIRLDELNAKGLLNLNKKEQQEIIRLVKRRDMEINEREIFIKK